MKIRKSDVSDSPPEFKQGHWQVVVYVKVKIVFITQPIKFLLFFLRSQRKND